MQDKVENPPVFHWKLTVVPPPPLRIDMKTFVYFAELMEELFTIF